MRSSVLLTLALFLSFAGLLVVPGCGKPDEPSMQFDSSRPEESEFTLTVDPAFGTCHQQVFPGHWIIEYAYATTSQSVIAMDFLGIPTSFTIYEDKGDGKHGAMINKYAFDHSAKNGDFVYHSAHGTKTISLAYFESLKVGGGIDPLGGMGGFGGTGGLGSGN